MAVKVVPVEKSDPLAVAALPPDERFEAAFAAASAKPADETPWERLVAAVVSDSTVSMMIICSTVTRWARSTGANIRRQSASPAT